MSLEKRIWRVLRGLGQSASDRYRSRGAREQVGREPEWAEEEARAEVEAVQPQMPSLPDWMELPEAPPSSAPQTSESPPPGDAPELPAPSTRPEPMRPAGDPLASHYAALGLPAGATIEQVEHAYRRLKKRTNPEQFAADPLHQARARQQDARLDEAYLALRQALVRERRL